MTGLPLSVGGLLGLRQLPLGQPLPEDRPFSLGRGSCYPPGDHSWLLSSPVQELGLMSPSQRLILLGGRPEETKVCL